LRRILLISGIVVGAFALIAAGLTVYAFFSLSSLVARNQNRILARVSDELGRPVQVGKIQAQMGWGVSVEVSGLTIADDPAFSAKPFLAAGDVSIEVAGHNTYLTPGKHVLTSNHSVSSYEQINPLECIGHRDLRMNDLEGGLRQFSSEFSLISALNLLKTRLT